MFKNKPFTSIYQYEWIDKLYKEKRLPASLHYRIGFVQKEFNWDLLLKNICITITKKLFLEGTKIVRDAGINLISEMANEINKIVDEVEENLSQFGLQMEQNLMATMHLCVLLSIWRESEEKQWNELYNPIDEMIRSKDTQWIAFEAALSGNHQEACKTVAEKIFMKIEKCYHQMKIEETNDKFDTIVEKEKDKLSRNSIQDSKDKQYIFSNKTNVDKGLDYLDHFIEIIQECFEKDWSALIESFFDEQNNAIHTASRVFFNDIEEKVVQLENDLEEKKLTIPTSMLFAIDNDHEESDCTQFQTQVEQTAMIYFHEYLSGIKTNTWYIGEIKIMTHPDIQGRLPQPATGISYESSKFVKREYFEQEVVLRLDLLCKYFIEQIQNAKRGWKNYNVFENEKVNEHVGNKKLQMKRLALGCDARCPTCKRFCDVDHGDIIAGSIESKHACQKGHQIRALAGNKLFDNEASVFTCEEMQFDDPITYKDEKMTWDKFIETVAIGSTKCWDFKDLLDKRAEHIVDIRYIDFWRMVGKEFCERETETGNEMLMCVDSNKSKLSKSNKNIIHAILALDASGSMNGSRWTSLLSAVKQFLSITAGKGYVSIITFDGSSKILIEHQPIDPILVNNIPYTGGGTVFANPMEDAYKLMKKYADKVEEAIYFLFMSDGGAEYPVDQINKINSLTLPPQFYAIAFPSVNSQLQQIANGLKGVTKTAVSEEMLLDTYSKIGHEILRPIS